MNSLFCVQPVTDHTLTTWVYTQYQKQHGVCEIKLSQTDNSQCLGNGLIEANTASEVRAPILDSNLSARTDSNIWESRIFFGCPLPLRFPALVSGPCSPSVFFFFNLFIISIHALLSLNDKNESVSLSWTFKYGRLWMTTPASQCVTSSHIGCFGSDCQCLSVRRQPCKAVFWEFQLTPQSLGDNSQLSGDRMKMWICTA